MASQTYDALNKAWKSTCRVLFGQEVGELDSFEGWLREYDEKLMHSTSYLSGKEVTFAQNDYEPSSRFVAFDEIDYGKKFTPLGINEIKDIDSIASAVQERASYCGNVVLGNSKFVEGSSSVLESHFVLGSTVVSDSKYVAHSRYVKDSEFCFGIFGSTYSQYMIKCMGSELKRCFECHMVEVLSDCYYCAKAQNCRDCMFCFGTYNASHMIGNTQLSKEKYAQIKAKLLGEIAEKLKKEHKAFSLLSLIEKCKDKKQDSRLKFPKEPDAPFDISPIEKAFRNTTSLMLGKELHNIDGYTDYLYRHVPRNFNLASTLTGSTVVVGGYRAHLLKKYDLEKRMVTEDEMRNIGKVPLDERKVEKISFDFENLVELLHPIAYTNLDKIAGQVSNSKNAAVAIDCADCYEGSAYIRSKKCSHCFWAETSESMFGCSAAWASSFCLKAYHCRKMTRAFECDNCQTCSDAYYLHNCENVRDSMFCFNAKNLTNAIGNAPLPQEQYKKVKSSIAAQLADELQKKKTLKWDICTIAAAGN